MKTYDHRPDETHLRALELGRDHWNALRTRDPALKPDLRGAALHGMSLELFDLREADLEGADLSASSLSGARLEGANLARANLNGADLSGAHLAGARFWETCVINANLSNAHGLGEADHSGPSPFDHRTFWRSKNIPKEFLQGCGVPESLIACYRASIEERPLELNSCFICHSSDDADFAAALHDDLERKGVRAWYAPKDGEAGRLLHEQLFEAISGCDKFLIVLSERSIESNWVANELRKAKEVENEEGRTLLFPVRITTEKVLRSWEFIDPKTGEDLAAAVLAYLVVDFEEWRDPSKYAEAFEQLLRGLHRSAGGA